MKKLKLTIKKTLMVLLVLTTICCTLNGCGSSGFSRNSSTSSSGSLISSGGSTSQNKESSSSNMDFSKNSDNSTDGPWLPDPGNALGAKGRYFSTEDDKGGTYDMYVYDYIASTKEMGSSIVTYGEALKDLGYSVKKLSSSSANEIYAQAYAKEGYQAEMGIFLTSANGANTADEDDDVAWRVVLAVPKGMTFALKNGTPGVVDGHTICKACGGSKKCSGCGGSGRTDYGNGYEKCVICNGNRICNVCDGAGYY